jgi:hypothetical protein
MNKWMLLALACVAVLCVSHSASSAPADDVPAPDAAKPPIDYSILKPVFSDSHGSVSLDAKKPSDANATLDGGNGKPAGAPNAAPGDAVPEPKLVGGEPDSIVQVANLVYAGSKSSQCFADHFLVKAEKETSISTSRRFHAVKLSSDEIYDFPLVIMTGEGAFTLPDQERANLARYIRRGGFLLASAGCSSQDWERSFRKEMELVFTDSHLAPLGMDHPIFHTVRDINELGVGHAKPRPLEGISFGGRLGVLYSQDGLNDTQHTQGCCCCGGNEITNAIDINVNVLAYALTY